jgi:tetratricopeptide (TPR) repeat protein
MFAVTLVALCSLVSVPPLPEAYQPLAAVWEDEKALTDTLRAIDKAQSKEMEVLMEALRGGAAPEGAAKTPDAIAAEGKQKTTDLRTVYELAVEAYPNNARLRTYYGEVLYDRFGDNAGAIKQWQQALSLDEEFSPVYNNLALHYIHLGEYAKGLGLLDVALKHDKKNTDYLFNMVNIYLVHFPEVAKLRKWDTARVYKEAMKLSKKAASLAEEDYTLLEDYAVNFYAAENFKVVADWEAAAKAWGAARGKARDTDEQFYCWLNEARVWMKAGENEKARPCLDEALRIRPESEPVRELLNRVNGVATESSQPAPQPEKSPASP